MAKFPLDSNPQTFEKFTPEGVAKRHRGCTFVAHVVPDSPTYEVEKRIQDDVRSRGLAEHFGLLPPSSYHMTVFPGLKDRAIEGESVKWPDWLSGVMDLPTAVGMMRQRLIDADLAPVPDLRMRPTHVYDLGISLTVGLEPVDDQMANELHLFRSTLRDVLEISDPGFDTYLFHSSLGYRLSAPELTSDLNAELADLYSEWVREIEVFDLERPAFNIFNDMLAFPEVLPL